MNPTEQEEKENSYRRKVHTTIETLIDIEHLSEIEIHLQNLHGIAWDEVIEERFVSKQCGFPACSRAPPKKKHAQMYHIDKKEGKIYESSTQRNKFCSEKCYHKSFFVRQQLEEQPLWITGLCEERINRKYQIPDETFVCPVTEKPEEEEENSISDKIEFIADSLIAQVQEMKLNEEFEEPKASDDPEEQLAEQYKLTEDDKDFIKSIKKFKANNFGSAKTPVEKKNVKITLSAKDQKKEEEILEKLRAKYGNKNSKQRKPPIIIDAPSLNQKKSTTFDIQNKEPIEEKEPWLINLIKSWFTSETRKMIREGARPSGGAAEQLFRDFMAGKKVDAEKQVNLPDLDKYNIKEKRLNVFLHSIRNHWLELEARLHLTPTRRDLLNRVAATFELNSENIVGWNKREINAIVVALFLVICLIDLELGDEYLIKENVSPELSSISSDVCGIDQQELTGLYTLIRSEIC